MKIILTVVVLLCLTLPVCAHSASPFQLPQYNVLVPQPSVAMPVRVAPVQLIPYWSYRRGLFGRWIVRRKWQPAVVIPVPQGVK